MPTTSASFTRLSIAPMLDWTDRHYRYMARLISRHTRLYTEMIHANALIHGNRDAFLAYDECEHPVALQLGGNQPQILAQAARLAAAAGFDEINLNCGCPSDRVQSGAFGACLMRDVKHVADCLNAMQDAIAKPVTVKHRIGLDHDQDYHIVRDFVGNLAHQSRCHVFIVHARNAWLQGLSPKENRDIPPLNYPYVYRLKQDFPDLTIIINGGINDNHSIAAQLHHVDGVMIGRAAYHQPMLMQNWDQQFFCEPRPAKNHQEIVLELYQYAQRILSKEPHVQLRHLTRHYLGLMHGLPRARRWRQMLCDPQRLAQNNPRLILDAAEEVFS